MPGFGATGFSVNGKYILASAKDKQVHILEVTTGKTIKSIQTNFDLITGVAMTADETIFITGSFGKLVPGKLFANPTYISKISLATGKEDKITGILGVVTQLQVSPDSSRLYGVGNDCSLRVWDAKTGMKLHAWENLVRVPRKFDQSSDGKLGLMALDTGPILLHLENFREGLKIPETLGHGASVCLIGDGSRGATVTKDITLKISDLKTGNVFKTIELAERDSSNKYGVAGGSPDGKHIYITGKFGPDDLYNVMEIDNGKFVARYQLAGPRGPQVASARQPDCAALDERAASCRVAPLAKAVVRWLPTCMGFTAPPKMAAAPCIPVIFRCARCRPSQGWSTPPPTPRTLRS